MNPRGSRVIAVIKKSEPEPIDAGVWVRLGEPEKHVGRLMKKGWRIIGDFHSHVNKLGNQRDEDIANLHRKVPGMWIFTDKTYRIYGPPRGIWGMGVPPSCKRGK